MGIIKKENIGAIYVEDGKCILSIIAAVLVVIAVNMAMPARATDDLIRMDIVRVDVKLVIETMPVRMVGK